MEIYLLFVGILFLMAYCAPASRGMTLGMAAFIFLISGLRYDVGFDYPAYYEWAKKGIDPYLAVGMEPLSRLMLEAVQPLGQPQLYFIWSSLIVVGLFAAAFLRRSRAPALSLFALFCMPMMFLVSMAIIRQYMAIALVFFAFCYFEKRFFICLGLMLLAGLFHYSAFLICAFYLGRRYLDREYSTFFYLAVLLLAPVLSSLLIKVVAPVLPFYASYLALGSDNGAKMIAMYYMIALLLLLLRRRLLQHVEISYFNAFLFGVAVYGLAGPVNEVVGRVAYYFLPYLCLLLPAVVKTLRPPQLSRLLVMTMLALLFFVQLYIASQNPDKDPYQPYRINTEMF